MNRHRLIVFILLVLFLTLWSALAGSATNDYQIGSGDVLKITIYDHPDLTTVARVDNDGYILFPLAGRIRVGDQTTANASQTIAEKLDTDYIVNPQVSVFVEEFRSKVVYVTGQVNRPSAFNVEPDTTVIQAVTVRMLVMMASTHPLNTRPKKACGADRRTTRSGRWSSPTLASRPRASARARV